MAPLLSVIVPVYNTKMYLRECIDSILAQTYKDYEIIIVDDGSTDGSSDICDEYAERFDIVKVIHKENCGLLHARKVGVSIARGKYISYIDSDDYILPQMYEYMVEKLQKHNADIAVCNIVFETDGRREPLKNYSKKGFFDKKKLETDIYPHMLFSLEEEKNRLIPSLCNKIIKKSILEKVLVDVDNSISFGEDALCSYPSLLDAENVYIAEDKFFYIYRQISTSLTKAYDKNLPEKFKLLIDLLEIAFRKRNFDGTNQLSCYAVSGVMECLRKELLFNKSLNVPERIKMAKEYVNIPRFKEAFEFASKQKFDTVIKIKILFFKKKRFLLLYMLFFIKNCYLVWKNRKKQ